MSAPSAPICRSIYAIIRASADMTLMVRQLAPDANGLPIEIYCFTNTVVWAEYEGIGRIFSTMSSPWWMSLAYAFIKRPPATIFAR